jgi:hypothetical protein
MRAYIFFLFVIYSLVLHEYNLRTYYLLRFSIYIHLVFYYYYLLVGYFGILILRFDSFIVVFYCCSFFNDLIDVFDLDIYCSYFNDLIGFQLIVFNTSGVNFLFEGIAICVSDNGDVLQNFKHNWKFSVLDVAN